jgi:hypothetical protein
MKQLLQITLVTLTLISCSNEKLDTKQTDQLETVSDSTISEIVEAHKTTEIPEPFDISQIDSKKGLDFTSGVLSKEDFKEYCDNSDNGIYGRYNLIDQNSELEHPVVGTIDIYKPDSESNWQASDSNQTIWKINLKSDVISVWDSIHVGLPRDKVVQFGQTNKGFCIKKGDFYYSCDFNNFSVVYNFKNDTLAELTVTRNCEKEKKKN